MLDYLLIKIKVLHAVYCRHVSRWQVKPWKWGGHTITELAAPALVTLWRSWVLLQETSKYISRWKRGGHTIKLAAPLSSIYDATRFCRKKLESMSQGDRLKWGGHIIMKLAAPLSLSRRRPCFLLHKTVTLEKNSRLVNPENDGKHIFDINFITGKQNTWVAH